MTFDEYVASERPRYESLAKIVEAILIAAIKRRPELRLQHTQRRAKDRDSLAKKLKRDGNLDTNDLDSVIKDLAGCRLVFYTNSGVSDFLSSGIVRDNFEVDWDRTKIHHPTHSSANAADLFVSNNYVVRLKADRAVLPEYASVAGIWCEVQVQTTLNHAWAETAHDTIYKKPDLPGGFGGTLMQSIEDRMANIMREHLLPAGYEFQKVLTDFERLSSGKELFDRGALEAAIECDDNNARHDLLERFTTYVLPNYDDVASIYPDIRSLLRKLVDKARATPTKPIETPFGTFPGNTRDEICGMVAAIFDRLRYADVEGTFDILIEMYKGAASSEEARRWIKSAEELAEHNIFVWQKAGPAVQQMTLARIQSMDDETKLAARPLLTAVLAKILEPEVTGTSSDFDKVTFSRGAIPVSESLRNVRSQAIETLKMFFLSAADDAERRAVSQALHSATRIAHSTGLTDRLHITVLEDSRNIVEFYAAESSKMGHELLQHIEHELLWLYRHNLPSDKPDVVGQEVEEARSSLRRAVLAFRDAINQDPAFQVYKTLVGYESVFAPAWENDEFDIEEVDNYRSDKIDELVASVSPANADEWLETLEACAATQSEDMATFPNFGLFLERLARTKPKIVLRYLDRMSPRLANFLPSMLVGLESGVHWAKTLELIKKWVSQGRYLSPIIWSFRSTKAVDVDLLQNALKQAVQRDDRTAVYNTVTVADRRHADVKGGLVETLLLPALRYLGQVEETKWANAIWGTRGESLFVSLSLAQAEEILGILVGHPKLHWREEDILTAIAKTHPHLVVDFFGMRLRERAKHGRDYDAIPFQFHRLQEVLSKSPSYVVQSARRWFADDPSLFSYRGGRFVSNIFKEVSADFEAELRALVRTGETSDLDFVIQVLRTYEGELFLHDIAKEIVERLPPDSELLNEVEMVLNETGVVAGEFGFVEVYQQKRDQMQSWLSDSRAHVRPFAEKYIRSLDRQIAAEQRRAEEDHELRKREWGSEDPEDGE